MSGPGNVSAVLFQLWVSTVKLQATEDNRLIKALGPNVSSLVPIAYQETLFIQFLRYAKKNLGVSACLNLNKIHRFWTDITEALYPSTSRGERHWLACKSIWITLSPSCDTP